MNREYENYLSSFKYLRLNEFNQLVLNLDSPLKIIDSHIHLSVSLPGQKNIRSIKGYKLKYPTVPPFNGMDLKVPYWAKEDYLRKKYSGFGAFYRFASEGIDILKDMHRGGSIENFINYQKENHICQSVLLPISTKSSDLSMNAISEAASNREAIIPFCSVHPGGKDIQKRLCSHVQRGAKGMKLKLRDSEIDKHFKELIGLLSLCSELALPVLFHTGSVFTSGDKKGLMSNLLTSTRVELFEKILKHSPGNLKLIFGHSGIQEYEYVASIMDKYPSTMAELSSQSESSIRFLINKTGSERLLFGSDWPALPPAITISNTLLATEESQEDRENILFNNANKLFN